MCKYRTQWPTTTGDLDVGHISTTGVGQTYHQLVRVGIFDKEKNIYVFNLTEDFGCTYRLVSHRGSAIEDIREEEVKILPIGVDLSDQERVLAYFKALRTTFADVVNTVDLKKSNEWVVPSTFFRFKGKHPLLCPSFKTYWDFRKALMAKTRLGYFFP